MWFQDLGRAYIYTYVLIIYVYIHRHVLCLCIYICIYIYISHIYMCVCAPGGWFQPIRMAGQQHLRHMWFHLVWWLLQKYRLITIYLRILISICTFLYRSIHLRNFGSEFWRWIHYGISEESMLDLYIDPFLCRNAQMVCLVDSRHVKPWG